MAQTDFVTRRYFETEKEQKLSVVDEENFHQIYLLFPKSEILQPNLLFFMA
jgi:hypothetical protein